MEILLIQSAEIDWFQLFAQYGEAFDSRFNQSTERLKSNPELGPPYRGNRVRRLVIQKTPWGIFYVPEPTRIIILAVEDLRQNPDLIKAKLKRILP